MLTTDHQPSLAEVSGPPAEQTEGAADLRVSALNEMLVMDDAGKMHKDVRGASLLKKKLFILSSVRSVGAA